MEPSRLCSDSEASGQLIELLAAVQSSATSTAELELAVHQNAAKIAALLADASLAFDSAGRVTGGDPGLAGQSTAMRIAATATAPIGGKGGGKVGQGKGKAAGAQPPPPPVLDATAAPPAGGSAQAQLLELVPFFADSQQLLRKVETNDKSAPKMPNAAAAAAAPASAQAELMALVPHFAGLQQRFRWSVQ